MSLTGEINKITGSVRRAIKDMAKEDITTLDGSLKGTAKICGYVCAIHEDGELAGTIDVQEFNYYPDEYDYKGTGHHEGVYLTAIQNNELGFEIVPMLFSEVVIVRNPVDGHEYVLMYSQARRMRLAAHSLEGEEDKSEVEISVTEVEKYNATADGLEKDYNELEPTKHKVKTTFKAKSITTQIVSPDDEDGYKKEKTVDGEVITIKDTKITIGKDSVTVETAKQCTIKSGTVTVTGGKLITKGISNTDLNGPFNAIKACPFSGAPHCGSIVSGT